MGTLHFITYWKFWLLEETLNFIVVEKFLLNAFFDEGNGTQSTEMAFESFEKIKGKLDL